MIRTRQATIDDVRRYYPDVTASFRAWVCEVDGVVSGIIGVVLSRPIACLFSVVDDSLKPFVGSMTIGRLIKKTELVVKASRVPVLAIAQDDIETSTQILERLGLSPLGVIDGDNVYEWRP